MHVHYGNLGVRADRRFRHIRLTDCIDHKA
jgi:hypothetical protein